MSLPSRRASHSVFFLPRCAIHPALRSLPTRRSSDLLCGDRLTLYATVEGETITSLQFEGEGCAISEIEEHTSELQSRGHLVCRLLLEKQKEGIGQDLTERRSSTLTGLMTLSHATTVR